MVLKNDIKNFLSDHITRNFYDGYMLLIEDLAKKFDIKLFEADFDDQNVSGQILREKDGAFSVYINRKHPITRKRFTAAHEIGHYISYVNGSFSKSGLDKEGFEDYVAHSRKSGGYDEKDIPAEKEANHIAAEILMREDMVRELMSRKLTPEEMAQKFNVSSSALVVRLQNLFPNLEIF